MKDWDDLRFFLALAREGTVSGAARVLSVNYTTVIRRLNTLEERLGVVLFERESGGYSLTQEGDELLQRSVTIEQEFIALDRQLSGKDQRLSGVIRFDTTEHLAALLMPELSLFSKQHPAIELQVITNLETINLAKRDADIALRVTNLPPENLVCEQLGNINSNVYGATGYLDECAQSKDLSDYRWLGWDQSYAGGSAARLVQNATPENAVIGCRVNSSASFNNALVAGLGIGYLWCFLGDRLAMLRKVNQDLPDVALGLWLIRHKDLANSQRLLTFSRFLQEAIQKHYKEETLW